MALLFPTAAAAEFPGSGNDYGK
ncbi:MAG: hypothetical protein CFH02_01504, partial [Alphaproteobacteria bacterium MarineAlpha3_Bin1]